VEPGLLNSLAGALGLVGGQAECFLPRVDRSKPQNGCRNAMKDFEKRLARLEKMQSPPEQRARQAESAAFMKSFDWKKYRRLMGELTEQPGWMEPFMIGLEGFLNGNGS
jgi:hypothetical protein